MKRDLQDRFMYLMECLSIVTQELTDCENRYLSNGKWDNEKIKANPFTINEEDNTQHRLIELYKKELENYKNVQGLIHNEFVQNNGWKKLINEIEDNLKIETNNQYYVNRLLKAINEKLSTLYTCTEDEDEACTEDYYTKNKYNGGIAFEMLNFYYSVFMGMFYELCIDYGIEFEGLTNTNKVNDNTKIEQPDSVKPQQYKPNTQKVTDVYNFCIDTNVISNDITEIDFINYVANANFKEIYANTEQQGAKSKCKYIIFILSYAIDDTIRKEWYSKTAHSIT
jgi:hypothetical protein